MASKAPCLPARPPARLHAPACAVTTLPAIFRCSVPQEAELLVNITKHTLVPQHRILTRDEKQTLLDRYKARGAARCSHACCAQFWLLSSAYSPPT